MLALPFNLGRRHSHSAICMVVLPWESPTKHSQEFLITGKHKHTYPVGKFVSPTLCPFACIFMALSQRQPWTKNFLKVCILSQPHTLIPFTFLPSSHLQSPIQTTHLCLVSFFLLFCKHSDLLILMKILKGSCHVTVMLQIHCKGLKMCTWAVQCEKLCIQIQNRWLGLGLHDPSCSLASWFKRGK